MEKIAKSGNALKGMMKKSTNFDNLGVTELKAFPNVNSDVVRDAVGESHSIMTGRVE